MELDVAQSLTGTCIAMSDLAAPLNGICGQEQEVVGLRRALPYLGVVGRRCALVEVSVVHQFLVECSVVSAQHGVGMLDHLVVVALVEIEACCEGMCGVHVEVPFRHSVVYIAHHA